MTTNISKEKREILVNKIKEIKQFIASNPQDENTSTLLSYIADIEKDIRGKKYGLVFEEHKEAIDELLESHTPVLSEEKDLFIDNGGQINFLLEGDNLASLQLLEKTHKGVVDIIYIDPPYNTGNEFVYNDKIIGKEDSFKHSKWISFMKSRLTIAKSILSLNGLIFISIDDHEQAALRLLCDEIFGEDNFIDALIWKKTENIKMDSKFLSQNKDYVLIYRKSGNVKEFNKQCSGTERFKLQDEKGLYYLRKLDSLSSSYSRGMDYIIEYEGKKYYPGGSYEQWLNRQSQPPKKKAPTWLWSKETFEKGLAENEIVFKNGNIYNKVRYDGIAKKPFINIQNIVSQQTAQKNLDKLFNERVFDHPKPPELISWLISLVKNNENALILDFFAGSGTTGQSVLELNNIDNGNRKFILCTNNENNICRDVTYERIKRVIEKEDYKASLKYMKVDFVPITDKLYYEYADELLKHIKELVELENGINFDGNKELSIILTEEELDTFTSNISSECKTIYLGHDVLPTEEQEDLFKKHKIKVNIIPDYYYRDLEG